MLLYRSIYGLVQFVPNVTQICLHRSTGGVSQQKCETHNMRFMRFSFCQLIFRTRVGLQIRSMADFDEWLRKKRLNHTGVRVAFLIKMWKQVKRCRDLLPKTPKRNSVKSRRFRWNLMRHWKCRQTIHHKLKLLNSTWRHKWIPYWTEDGELTL